MKPGDSMLHYRIGELIGVGGMGEVHQATDSRLDREVAIKLLPANVSGDPDRRQRFEREARTLAALQHPNIATIHGLEQDDGRLFLVMELVRGDDLKTRLDRGALPLADTLDIARQVAAGLEEAHAQGIVHRDLKPANVKLTPDGMVKILDFGLARAMQDPALSMADPSDSPTLTVGMTRDGSILGTAAYMSPEQARGREVDARADVWAFGCLVFEMLSGRSPFGGETASDSIAAVLKTEPDWTLLPKDLPPALHRLLRRCLAKDPRDRLHAVADARLDLAEALAEPVRPAAAVRAGRRGVPPWAAVLGWLAAAAVLFFWLNAPSPVVDPVRMDVLTYSTRDWAPDVSPDGNLIAFVSDRDGTARIWLKQLTGGGEAPLTGGSDDAPRFSPDGTQILFARDVADTRHLYRAAVVGGQERKVLEDAVEGDWSPDGEQIAFLRTPPDSLNLVQVGVADVRSGAERILHTIENRLVYGVRWSPDGSRLAVDEASLTGNAAETSTIDLIDLETGAMTRMSPTVWSGPFSGVEWAPDGRSFIFGQAADVISHVSGQPSLVMEYDLDKRNTTQLFWSPMRLPKGGWGYSSLSVLGDGALVLDEQVVYAELREVDLAGGGDPAGRVLGRSLGIDRQPVFSADGRRLLFSSNRSGNVDLWLRDMDTGRLSQLTDDPAGDWDPAFTPDGRSILWSSNRSGHMEVWMSALDGSQARQVSNDGVDAENPTMTADGEWIIYASSNDAKRGIWKVRPDGSEAALLTAGSYLLPDVSPDGRWVVFMSLANMNYIVHALELETGRMLPFTIQINVVQRNENLVYGRARWTPDGTAILYIGQDAAGNSGILRQTFTPEAAPVAEPEHMGGFNPLFTTESLGISPDGTRLIISALHEQRVLKQAHNVPLAGWR